MPARRHPWRSPMSHRHPFRASRGQRPARSARTAHEAAAPARGAVLERLESRQLLTAVVSDTLFLANQKSGIPVSNSDLINGLIPAPADTNYVRSFEGGPIDNLTDGKTAATPTNLNEFSAQQNAVFSLDGGIPAPQQHGNFWYAIYRLPLGAAPAGYDITQVNSVTGHQDNRTDQTIDIE